MKPLALREKLIPPAAIADPKTAETQMRGAQALLDVMRRGRADLREQVKMLRQVIAYAYRGIELLDEMEDRGELAQQGDNRWIDRRTSAVYTLKDLELDHRRVAEWRTLRDHGALAFIDAALADERESTFEKASLNWVLRRVERIGRESEHAATTAPAYDYEIRHGDLRNTLDDLAGTVDVIVTDPPYPAEFLEEFDALGEVAARLLKPGGLLVAMVGHAYLPEYLERLGRHLTYRWCAAYLLEGPAARVFGRSMATKWKPLLLFDHNEARRFLTQDVFTSARPDKATSRQIDGWTQSETGMLDIVDHLTEPGDLVVDPFLGAGTTALACRQLGRRFVGCDKDPDAVRIARERLDEMAVAHD
jgi:SAM-dependent methyltransferase